MTYDIKTFNTIAQEGLERLTPDMYTLNESENPDGIILRSQKLHDYPLPSNLKAIARAGAGTNNIPIERCSEKGIVVFNTPGANANAVKELVLACLLLSVRPILDGAQWVQNLSGEDIPQQAEAGKKQFSGTELASKRLGVIGLGSIGSIVANDAYRLGLNVVGYDPFVSVDTAWNISRRVKRAETLSEVLETSDFLSIHIPFTEQTKHLIGEAEIASIKDNAVILNFARGELVDTDALLKAMETRPLGYITDFAEEKLIHKNNILLLPHLGASTEEAEINCAKVAAKHLKNYLETGNIKQSVNFPTIDIDFHTPYRLSIINKNVPNILGQISTVLANLNFNIENMINRGSGDYAYTLVDITNVPDEKQIALAKAHIKEIPEIIMTRLIKNTKVVK